MRKQRSRHDYAYKEIILLRKDVLKAYNYYERDIPFTPNTTRESDGYIRLLGLIKDMTKHTVGFSTMVLFLTKNPIIEGKRKIFPYETYTYNAFAAFVKKYKEDTSLKNTKSSNACSSNNFTERTNEIVGTLFDQLYQRNKSISGVERIFKIEENGTCEIAGNVYIQALSPIALVKLHFISRNKITVTSVEAFDSTAVKKSFYVFQREVTDYSYLGYIIFSEILAENAKLYYGYSVTIANYYKELIEKKVVREELKITVNTYKSIIDEYHFPDTLFFKRLKVTVTSHPDPKLHLKEVIPTYISGRKIYKIDHGSLEDLSIPIKLHFHIPD